MMEDKSGLLVNLFDKDFIYAIGRIDESTLKEEDIIKNSSETEETTVENVVKGKGDNNKGVIILIEDASVEHIQDSQVQVLSKIFEALKLSLNTDALILNVSKNPSLKRDYFSSINSKVIISFGVNLFKLGFEEVEFYNYEIKEIDQLLILQSEPIQKMTAKVDAKKAFWLAIQRALSNL